MVVCMCFYTNAENRDECVCLPMPKLLFLYDLVVDAQHRISAENCCRKENVLMEINERLKVSSLEISDRGNDI